jgi:ABC-type uncharacterized transport system permease subunit
VNALATIAFYLGVIAYSAASTLFFLELARQSAAGPRSAWGPRVLALGAVFHMLHVVTASLLLNRCPIESLHFGLSFSALVAVSAFLLLRRHANLDPMGVLVAPIALTFLVGAQFVGVEEPEALVSRPLLMLHVTANVVGLGIFVVAGTAGLLYLLQERRLRDKRAGGVASRLPSLDALDRATYRLLLSGFPLLTLGVVTGAIFSRHLTTSGGAAIARTLLGFTTWFLLATMLLLRRLAGVRGRRVAYGAVVGVVCVLLVVVVYAVRTGGPGS